MTNEQNLKRTQFIFKRSEVLTKDAHLFYSYELGIKEFIFIFKTMKNAHNNSKPTPVRYYK